MKPLIEIMGPWLKNHGDMLMLWSTVEHFQKNAELCVSSTLGLDRIPEEPRLLRTKSGPGFKAFARALASGNARWLAGLFRDAVVLRTCSHERLSGMGLADERRTALLVDCSGFAYGDPWSLYRVHQRIAYYSRLRRNGTRIVMLPQAFGPFELPETRDAIGTLLGCCDLVFARDRESRDHLDRLALPPTTKLAVAPDITHLLSVELPEDAQKWRRRVCVVPNARMLDKAARADRDAYNMFVDQTIEEVRAAGFEPVILVHEENDLPLARQLAEQGGALLFHEDARHTKGILGASHAVVSSRFHACVSGLSQGVPTIGTSWSHKYERLFQDYGCADLVIAPSADPQSLSGTLQGVLEPNARDRLANRLSEAAHGEKAKVRAMWNLIDELMPAAKMRR